MFSPNVTAIALPTPQSIAYRYSCIARRWWLHHGGQEATQEFLLALVLSMAANYFYYIELAIGFTFKAVKVIVEYAPLVWQMVVAGVYALAIKAQAQLPGLIAATRLWSCEDLVNAGRWHLMMIDRLFQVAFQLA